MTEPFGNPTSQQLERARQLYSDPLIYWATNTAIKALQKLKSEGTDITNTQFKEWKRITRLMFLNIPAVFIIEETYKIAGEVAEGTWKDFVVPDLTKKETKGYDPALDSVKGKITISQVLNDYGIKTRGNKAICPFHSDKDPSLSFDNQKGLWNCFGCSAQGDIFTLIGMLEELENGK